MKKILLTLMVGFCVGGVAVAQEPTKLAKKKAGLPLKSSVPGNNAAKVQAKEARAKAIETGRLAPATPSIKVSKDAAQ